MIAVAAFALVLAVARPCAAAPVVQKVFKTPDEAAQALAGAIKADDMAAMLAVLGPEAEPLISSGDPVADENRYARFTEAYEARHSLATNQNGDTVLQIGSDDWPFPIPLVQTEAGWRFDAEAGREEILDRRIGANELAAIQACLAYVDAQREYYDQNPDDAPLLHFAQQFVSTPGKRDGLYWETQAGEPPSPLGEVFADARAEGYEMKGQGDPYHGYYYRILTAQGPAADGGAYDYVAHGRMIGGFGLVAYPAKWDNSGVMTFIVNQDAVVFQKDLGPDTAAAAKAIKTFNPDDSWQRVSVPGTTASDAPTPSAQRAPAAEPGG